MNNRVVAGGTQRFFILAEIFIFIHYNDRGELRAATRLIIHAPHSLASCGARHLAYIQKIPIKSDTYDSLSFLARAVCCPGAVKPLVGTR